jgi:hypothetical protein
MPCYYFIIMLKRIDLPKNVFFKYITKVKVKFSLCLTKHYSMKTCWESGGVTPRILNLGTRWR